MKIIIILILLLTIFLIYIVYFNSYDVILSNKSSYTNIPIKRKIPKISETIPKISDINEKSKELKGIMYFDIDGTLITANKNDIESNMQLCLDNNYAIGIITASNREIHHLCNGDNPVEEWMPKTLCKFMKETNYITYNADHIVAGMKIGDPNFPKNYPPLEYDNLLVQGVKKGYQMKYGQEMLNIKDPKQIVLFDDYACVLVGAKKYNPNGTYVCAGDNCNNSCGDGRQCKVCESGYLNNLGKLQLDNKIIKNTINNLK
jgi:hypothetical protein